jgi:hypothetical protein
MKYFNLYNLKLENNVNIFFILNFKTKIFIIIKNILSNMIPKVIIKKLLKRNKNKVE